jgi:hypothetical protein
VQILCTKVLRFFTIRSSDGVPGGWPRMSAMMKRLKMSALLRGDIILTTTAAAVSKAIRWGTKSDISHAMICVQHGSVIDATSEGVHARNTQRLFFEDGCALHVLRFEGWLDTRAG